MTKLLVSLQSSVQFSVSKPGHPWQHHALGFEALNNTVAKLEFWG